MNETAPRVIKIPAKPESVRQAELQRQLRVAAYCRVSTKEEDQTNSYEVQKEYYTDKIMSNPVCGPWRASSPTRAPPALR